MFDGTTMRGVSLNTTDESYMEPHTTRLNNDTLGNNTMSSLECLLACRVRNPTQKVVLYFMSPSILLMGLCCTIILLISIFHKRTKYSTDCFLLGFTFAEVLKYIGGLTYLGLLYLMLHSKPLPVEFFQIFVSKYLIEVMYRYPSSVSKVIVAIMSLERVVAVFQPFKFRGIRTFKNGKIITFATYCICGFAFISSQAISNVNAGAIYSMFVCLVVLVTICISNVATLFGLFRTSTILSCLSDTQVKQRIKTQQKITKVLLGVSFACVVCSILPLVLHISAIIYKESWETQKSEKYWIILMVFAPVSDFVLSVSNLAFFIINDKKFRESILYSCGCFKCCCKQNK